MDLSATSLTINEGFTGSYTIKLATSILNGQDFGSTNTHSDEPGQSGQCLSTRIGGASSDTGKATITSGARPLFANAGSFAWSIARTVTVTGVEDADAEDETITIAHAVRPGQDCPQHGYTTSLSLPSVTVIVLDDDAPPDVTLSLDSSGIAENGDGERGTVALAVGGGDDHGDSGGRGFNGRGRGGFPADGNGASHRCGGCVEHGFGDDLCGG